MLGNWAANRKSVRPLITHAKSFYDQGAHYRSFRIGFGWLNRVWTDEIQPFQIAAIPNSHAHAVTANCAKRDRRPVATSENNPNSNSDAAGIWPTPNVKATPDANGGSGAG